MTAARMRLAAQQANLLAALLTDAPPPPGFDAAHIAVEARSLRAKRRRVVAHLRPDLRRRVGVRFPELFDRYARTHPKSDRQRARDDAATFAIWLDEQGWGAPRHRRRLAWVWQW